MKDKIITEHVGGSLRKNICKHGTCPATREQFPLKTSTVGQNRTIVEKTGRSWMGRASGRN